MNEKKPVQDGYQEKTERFGYQPSNKLEKGYQPKPIQVSSKPPTGGPGIKPPQS